MSKIINKFIAALKEDKDYDMYIKTDDGEVLKITSDGPVRLEGLERAVVLAEMWRKEQNGETINLCMADSRNSKGGDRT